MHVCCKLNGTCYAIRSTVHISKINAVISIYNAYFHSVIKYGTIFGVNLPTLCRFSLYKRKSSELWLEHNPEPHVEVCLND
jgi:hypothetical protein